MHFPNLSIPLPIHKIIPESSPAGCLVRGMLMRGRVCNAWLIHAISMSQWKIGSKGNELILRHPLSVPKNLCFLGHLNLEDHPSLQTFK